MSGKLPKIGTRFFAILLLTVVAAGLPTCGLSTSGVMPTASLPPPGNDDQGSSGGITVSSPNDSGLVVVTGDEAAVPDGATVVVQVGSASQSISSLNALRWLDTLIPAAHAASSCVTDIPTCPELDDNGQCQVTALDDGSFTLEVPADLNANIEVWYLNPGNCDESEHFEGVISDDVLAVELSNATMQFDQDEGVVYLFGTDLDGNNEIHALNASTRTTEGIVDVTLTGVPEGLTLFTGSDNNDYIFLQTETDTAVALFDGTSVRGPQNFYYQDHSMRDVRMTGSQSLSVSSSDSYLTCHSAYTAGQSYTRVFLTQDATESAEAQLFVVPDFTDDYNSGDIEMEALDLGIYIESALHHYLEIDSSATIEFESVPFADILGDYFFVVVEFTVDGADATRLAAMKFSARDAFCQVFYPSIVLDLGTATGDVHADSHFITNNDSYTLSLLKVEEQGITILGVASMTITSSISFAAYPDLVQISHIMLQTDNSGNNLVLLLSEALGGWAILNTDTLELMSGAFEEDNVIRFIAPEAIEFDTANDLFIVLDEGIEDDDWVTLTFL